MHAPMHLPAPAQAQAALKSYGHSLVVANRLDTRADIVSLVEAEGDRCDIARPEGASRIEGVLVAELERRHSTFLS